MQPNNPNNSTGPIARSPKPAAQLAPTPSPPRGESSHADLPFAHYSWLLRAHSLRMACFVILVVMATALVSARLTPLYESSATLYIDGGAAKNLVGQDSQSATVSQIGEAETFLASQIRLMQSDAVVRPLAEKYDLLQREGQVNTGTMSPARIAKIRSAPIVLNGLRITRFPNTDVLQIGYRSTDPDVSAAIANGVAQSYIEHTYEIRIRSSADLSRFMSRELQGLRAKAEESSAKLAALERELNVVNPEEKTNILASRLLQLNTEFTRVQSERVKAESLFNSLSAGSLEAALGASQNDDLREAVRRLNDARGRFADVRSRFGVNHPEYDRQQAAVKELESQLDASVAIHVRQSAVEFHRAQNQEALLQRDLVDTKQEYDHLNARYFEYQRAKQEADTDRLLYEELVKRIRQDEINSGFQNNMARISDVARPPSRPFYPNVPLNLALAFMGSSIVAIFAVILSDRVDTTIRNPEQVTRSLQARLLGVLPSIGKEDLVKGLALEANSEPGYPAQLTPNRERHHDARHSAFDESVRTILNSVLLTDFDSRLRSVLMTSATPSEGKSTVAAHIAVSNAEQRRRTLLIDADMRRPSIHRLFRIPNSGGLTKVLDGEIQWRDALIQPRPDLELYVLPAGATGRRSADQVGQQLPQLLEEASEEFGLTIVDAPPLLGFPEPLQMAAAADGVIVVTRAAKTDRIAVAAVLGILHDLRANMIGLILNEVRKEMLHSYYYYDAYSKYYGTPKQRNRRGTARNERLPID